MAVYTENMQDAIYINDAKDVSKFSARVLLDLFIGLLFTAAVTFGFSYLIYYLAVSGGREAAIKTIYIIMFVTGISVFIVPIAINRNLRKKGVIGWGWYLTYCFLMGGFLSTMTVFIKPWIIGTAFLASAIIFLICYFIGYYSKANLTPLGIAGFGLLFGCMFVSIPFLILFMVFPGAFLWYEYVISIVLVIALVFLTSFDSYRMKRDIMGQALTKQDALFYSYMFYSDFIGIFIRILYILSLSDRD